MSTNFYQIFPGTKRAPRHIGLSAGGMFLFRAYPGQHLTSYRAWMQELREATIVDEYDKPVTFQTFDELVSSLKTEAQENPARRVYHNSPVHVEGAPYKMGHRYRDADGHCFGNYNFS